MRDCRRQSGFKVFFVLIKGISLLFSTLISLYGRVDCF